MTIHRDRTYLSFVSSEHKEEFLEGLYKEVPQLFHILSTRKAKDELNLNITGLDKETYYGQTTEAFWKKIIAKLWTKTKSFKPLVLAHAQDDPVKAWPLDEQREYFKLQKEKLSEEEHQQFKDQVMSSPSTKGAQFKLVRFADTVVSSIENNAPILNSPERYKELAEATIYSVDNTPEVKRSFVTQYKDKIKSGEYYLFKTSDGYLALQPKELADRYEETRRKEARLANREVFKEISATGEQRAHELETAVKDTALRPVTEALRMYDNYAISCDMPTSAEAIDNIYQSIDNPYAVAGTKSVGTSLNFIKALLNPFTWVSFISSLPYTDEIIIGMKAQGDQILLNYNSGKITERQAVEQMSELVTNIADMGYVLGRGAVYKVVKYQKSRALGQMAERVIESEPLVPLSQPKLHRVRPLSPEERVFRPDLVERGLDSSVPRRTQRAAFSDGLKAVRRSGRLQEKGKAVTPESLRTTTKVSEIEAIFEYGSESQRKALLENPNVPPKLRIKIQEELGPKAEPLEVKKETKPSPKPQDVPVKASEPSPASSWLLKPLSEFETEVVLSPEEMAFLRDTIGEGKKVEWTHLEETYKQAVQQQRKIGDFDLVKLLPKLTPIAEKLRLRDPLKLILEYKAGKAIVSKKMPIYYKVLKYLLENTEETGRLDKMDLPEVIKTLAKELKEKPYSVRSAILRLQYFFREFGENRFSNISKEYETFCKTGKLPKKWIFLDKIILKDKIRTKLLNHMVKLPEKKLAELKGLNNAEIGRRLETVLNENAGTLAAELGQIKRYTGAVDITQLAEQARIVVKGGKIERPPMGLADIIGEDSASAKLLEYLAELSKEELTEIKGLSDNEISRKLETVLNENAGTLAAELGQLRRYFRERDLIELVEKYKELKEKGQIFGFSAPDGSALA